MLERLIKDETRVNDSGQFRDVGIVKRDRIRKQKLKNLNREF